MWSAFDFIPFGIGDLAGLFRKPKAAEGEAPPPREVRLRLFVESPDEPEPPLATKSGTFDLDLVFDLLTAMQPMILLSQFAAWDTLSQTPDDCPVKKGEIIQAGVAFQWNPALADGEFVVLGASTETGAIHLACMHPEHASFLSAVVIPPESIERMLAPKNWLKIALVSRESFPDYVLGCLRG